ncbi:2,5-diamino-6-ribosylamino-4(3H)-pyrimidinone 5'-phosphate reductase [uncultured archaeon]|nr:2,5-diamino-6-ribosylamino-4(3H)-pyrimidinone 5'-phosphate reductase [uncultured archaeon]
MDRPFVFINSAMSADGKISSILHRQVRISGTEDLIRVDELRASSDAIMVGIGTVLADDPGLRVKSELLRKERLKRGTYENPLRIVADSLARTPPGAEVLGAGCIIAVSRAAPPERLAALSDRCKIFVSGEGRVDLIELMSFLHKIGVKRLMVEGGAILNWTMISAGLVDEIYVYVGSMLIGGDGAPSLLSGAGFYVNFPKLELISLERLGEGVLLRWHVGDVRTDSCKK